jgi:hypothetical protein
VGLSNWEGDSIIDKVEQALPVTWRLEMDDGEMDETRKAQLGHRLEHRRISEPERMCLALCIHCSTIGMQYAEYKMGTAAEVRATVTG